MVAFFGYCALWMFWLQLMLSSCGWLLMIILRLHHIYVVVTTRKKPDPRRIWLLYLPLLLNPIFIFCTVANASRHPCGIYKQRCVVSSDARKLSMFLVLPPIYFSIFVFCGSRDQEPVRFSVSKPVSAREGEHGDDICRLPPDRNNLLTNTQNNVEG